MTRKYLKEWYEQGDITYSEKERLNKIGIGDYDRGNYLQDLKRILFCENIANAPSEIRNNLSGRTITRIIFFTPDFNDSKPDASNYICATLSDSNNNTWAIIYRSSYTKEIGADIIVKRVSKSPLEVLRMLNSNCPIAGVAEDDIYWTTNSGAESYITWPYVYIKDLPSDAKYNPDKYILPLDVVKRPIDKTKYHFGIYLGNEQVVHLPGGENPTRFDTWREFCVPGSSSGSSSSSSSSGSSGTITVYHPQIPFKRKEEIIRHIAKVVSYEYGRYSYSWEKNNCEHLAFWCVLGLKNSLQVDNFKRTVEAVNVFSPRLYLAIRVKLEDYIRRQNNELDNLTFSYSYEKGKIEQCIREAENNRSYTFSKYWIEQEKFQDIIEVYPKDWCRIS